MIVKHIELKKNLKDNINYYLLYGANIGLIEENIDHVFKPNFSKNIFQHFGLDVDET